jgi:hypothetical protein
MRRPDFFPGYAGLYAAGRSKYFLMYRLMRHPEGDEITVHISQKGGWSAYIKVGSHGNGEFLQTRKIPMPSNVELVGGPIGWTWFAVRDGRMTSGNGGQQLPRFLSKDMFPGAARSMDPPHVPGRFCTGCRKSVQH